MNWADRFFSWLGGRMYPKPASGPKSEPPRTPPPLPVSPPVKPKRDAKPARSDKKLHRRIWSKDVATDPEKDARLYTPTLLRSKGKSTLFSTDLAQLSRYGLPIWWSDDELAAALEISRQQLWYFSSHRQFERQPHYITFRIPKATGGERLIMAPKKQLKAIQRRLLGLLVNRLPVSDNAHAYRVGRSIKTAAEPHVGKPLVVKMDLQDFFPTVTIFRVRGLLMAYGYSYCVASTLAVIMTEAERQPVEVDGELFHVPVGQRYCVQGAPTSPGLCNSLLLRMDRCLAGFARKSGLAYTRYADDLTFSGTLNREQTRDFIGGAYKIIRQEGFEPKIAKTRVMSQATRQVVTGVVVNQTLGLSRQERRRLRAAIHQQTKRPGNLAKLEGQLAYLSMLNTKQAAPLLRQLKDV